MANVYVETTILSYLAAGPSRDLVVAARQQITHEWWKQAANRFDLFVSEVVLEEIRRGDPSVAARRLAYAEAIPVVVLTEDARQLASLYQGKLGLPKRAEADSLHIALAVSYEFDYLVTWNCSHIANGQTLRRLMELNNSLNRFTPLLLTPTELMPITEENANDE